MAVAMALQSVALAADGPFELVRILDSGAVFGTDTRLFAAYVDHGLVVAAARAGVSDTHVLTVLMGVGQLVVPALLWCVAIVLTRHDRLVWAVVAMVATVSCATMSFAGVSPVSLAVPLTTIVAAALWLPRAWRTSDVVLALGSCVVLLASYEWVALTGAVLVCWAVWRRARSSTRLERHGCTAIAALSALSAAIGVIGTRRGNNPEHSQSFLYFVVSLEPWPFYVALGGIAALAAGLGPWLPTPARRFAVGAGLLALVVATVGARPDPVTSFQARGGVAIAGLALELFLLLRWLDGERVAKGTSRYAGALLVAVPLVLAAVLTVANVHAANRWSQSLDAFRSAVNATSGVTDVTIATPQDRREVLWGWTSSSLSLVVRNHSGAGVLVDPNPLIVPFPPAVANDHLPDKYTWRCSIPC
jgi:hypothetical protein